MRIKSIFIAAVALLISISAVQLHAQTIPDVTVEDIKGTKISSKEIVQADKPTIISLWATWCKPCIQEIDNISELLEDWMEELDFKYVAISIDDARASSKARSFAVGRGWDGIEIFFDVNGDFRRAMNVSQIPHILIFDSDGNLVYSHSGYVPGGEADIFTQLKKISE